VICKFYIWSISHSLWCDLCCICGIDPSLHLSFYIVVPFYISSFVDDDVVLSFDDTFSCCCLLCDILLLLFVSILTLLYCGIVCYLRYTTCWWYGSTCLCCLKMKKFNNEKMKKKKKKKKKNIFGTLSCLFLNIWRWFVDLVRYLLTSGYLRFCCVTICGSPAVTFSFYDLLLRYLLNCLPVAFLLSDIFICAYCIGTIVCQYRRPLGVTLCWHSVLIFLIWYSFTLCLHLWHTFDVRNQCLLLCWLYYCLLLMLDTHCIVICILTVIWRYFVRISFQCDYSIHLFDQDIWLVGDICSFVSFVVYLGEYGSTLLQSLVHSWCVGWFGILIPGKYLVLLGPFLTVVPVCWLVVDTVIHCDLLPFTPLPRVTFLIQYPYLTVADIYGLFAIWWHLFSHYVFTLWSFITIYKTFDRL